MASANSREAGGGATTTTGSAVGAGGSTRAIGVARSALTRRPRGRIDALVVEGPAGGLGVSPIETDAAGCGSAARAAGAVAAEAFHDPPAGITAVKPP